MLITIKDIVKDTLQLFWGRKKYKFALKNWLELPDLQACSRVLQTMRFTDNLQPVELKYPQAKRILVISPHPDDLAIGAGGTLYRAIHENNAEVIVNMGIREYQPDCIFIPSFWDDHIDHRNANKLLLSFEKTVEYKNIAVWSYQVYSTIIPNVVVDITKERDQKVKAIREFKSQLKHRDWAHYALGLNAFNVRFLRTNKPKYAEAFFVVPLWEYIKLCEVYFKRDD